MHSRAYYADELERGKIRYIKHVFHTRQMRYMQSSAAEFHNGVTLEFPFLLLAGLNRSVLELSSTSSTRSIVTGLTV